MIEEINSRRSIDFLERMRREAAERMYAEERRARYARATASDSLSSSIESLTSFASVDAAMELSGKVAALVEGFIAKQPFKRLQIEKILTKFIMYLLSTEQAKYCLRGDFKTERRENSY